VTRVAPDSDEAKRIDGALGAWRQGDLALDELWFVHVGDAAVALSDAAAQSEEAGVQAFTSDVAGLVVVSQTCDIVRSCVTHPYVEVAPLVEVDEKRLLEVQRGRRPGRATLPSLAGARLVADLDRVMTLEKSVVATWTRTAGYVDDADGRRFAHALARKRVRFAFPDDFVAFARKLEERLKDKHDKDSDEGRGLRALREIRVQATPFWEASQVAVFFWFIRNGEDADFEGENWAALLAHWLKRLPASGRFKSVDGQVATLEDMSAQEYLDSDPFDLDHLSTGFAQ
jgi:hypothetical protein